MSDFQNTEPFQIIAAPFTIYLAPVGTAFPTLDNEPAAPWMMVGGAGDEDYNEEGVTVSHTSEEQKWRGLGSTAPRKAFRTEEDLMVAFQLHDMTLENYALALNGNSVTTTAPSVDAQGTKSMSLLKGCSITEYALLARGNASAYGAGLIAQYQIARCFQMGSAEPVFQKGEPAGLALEFGALLDPNATSDEDRFGKLVMGHLAATG